MTTFKNIIQNFGANSISSALIMLYQFVSVPLFINFWGVNLYGEWLVLNAVTAYFAMTDIGINTATANEYSYAYVNNDHEKANVLINNNLLFILISCAILGLLFYILILFSDLSRLLNITLIDEKVAELVFMLLYLKIFVGLLCNTMNTIYRACEKYSRGMNIDNIIRFSEYALTLLSIIFGYTLVTLVVLVIIPKLIGLLFKIYDSKKFIDYQIGLGFISWPELKSIIAPAFSFLSFPISNSLLIEGFILIINSMLGSSAVVLFKTTRTLVNSIKSVLGIINTSVWPEFSLAFGRRNLFKMRSMFRYTLKVTLLLSILVNLVLLFSGEMLYNLWVGDDLNFNSMLFYLLIVASLIQTTWNSIGMVLQATNKHQFFSVLLMMCSFLSVGIGYYLVNQFQSLGIIPVAFILTDLILLIYVIKKVAIIIDESWVSFLDSFKTDFKLVQAKFMQ